MIQKILKGNRMFLLSFISIWIVALSFSFLQEKTNTHLILNSLHSPNQDLFYKYLTYLGGGFPAYVGLFLLLISLRKAVLLLGGQAIALAITQSLKHSLNFPRPAQLFSDLGLSLPPSSKELPFTIGRVFPSGHTSAIFAFFFCLSLIARTRFKYIIQLGLLVSAAFVAYSRVYLSQHFVEDCLAGSLIGIFSAAMAYYFIYQKKWGEASLLFYLKRKTQSNEQ